MQHNKSRHLWISELRSLNGRCLRNMLIMFFLVACSVLPLLAQEGADFEQLAQRASLAREQHDTRAAIGLYSQAVKLNPQWPEGWWFLGFLQYSQGSYAGARDALTRFIDLTPEPGPAIGLRGLCEFETGEYERSLADIRAGMSSALAEQARSAEFLRFREAQLLTRLGKFDEALKTYSFLAQNKITDPELLAGIGLAALRRPLLPKDTSPDIELVKAVGSAVFQFLDGDEKDGEREFDALLEHYPAISNEHYAYGFFLFAFDPEGALSQFKLELKMFPSNENAKIMVAWALLIRREPAEALPYARCAAESQPELATAQLVLGRALSETGDVKDGLGHLQEAVRLDSNDVETHIALAWSYSRSGDRIDAERERQICLQMTRDGINRIALP